MNTKTCSIQMTTGSLWKNILLFSLPLMMTQVLEVLFNLSDVAIAGKFADYIALGAVEGVRHDVLAACWCRSSPDSSSEWARALTSGRRTDWAQAMTRASE